MSKIPGFIKKTLEDAIASRFYEERQRFLLLLGETMITHLCSFILAEYKKTGLISPKTEKSIINSKKSISLGIYLEWIRETSSFMVKNNKPSLFSALLEKEDGHQLLSEFVTKQEILKKAVESGIQDNLLDACLTQLKGRTFKKVNLNTYFSSFVQLRNKIAHPLYEAKGKTIAWPFNEDYYKFIIPALEDSLKACLELLSPLWDYGVYLVREQNEGNLYLFSEDNDTEIVLTSNADLQEGVRALLSSNQEVLINDWSVLLKPSEEGLKLLQEEHEQARKLNSITELKSHIVAALDDGQITTEEFKFLQSISRTKLDLNSGELKNLILEVAKDHGVEEPFPETDIRFVNAIDTAIKNQSYNELVLRLMGQQFGVEDSDFDKIVDSRAYALGVSPEEARKSGNFSFSKEELFAYTHLQMARHWIMAINTLNTGGGSSNYKIVNDSNKLGTPEYWHKKAFSNLNAYVKLRLKFLQQDGGLDWDTKQNQWQIGNMTSYAWCSIFPRNAPTKAALALHVSLYASGSAAIGLLPDWKDYKAIEHYGLLLATTRKNLNSALNRYQKEFSKYNNLVLWNSYCNDSSGSIMRLLESYPWLIIKDYNLDQIQFFYNVQEINSSPWIIGEALDVSFNLFNNLIPEIIEDYNNLLPDLNDPLKENEEMLKEILSQIKLSLSPFFSDDSASKGIEAGSYQGGKLVLKYEERIESYPFKISFEFVPSYQEACIYFQARIIWGEHFNDFYAQLEKSIQRIFSAKDFELFLRPGSLILESKLEGEKSSWKEVVLNKVNDFMERLTLGFASDSISILDLQPNLSSILPYKEEINSSLDLVLDKLSDCFSIKIKKERNFNKKLMYLDYVSSGNKHGYHWIGWGLKYLKGNFYFGTILHVASTIKGSVLSDQMQNFQKSNTDWVLLEQGVRPERSEAVWMNGILEDKAYQSSSDYNRNHSAALARLNAEPKTANWSSLKCDDQQWLQIDLGEVKTIWGIAIQGRYNRDQWITMFSIQTSVDGKTWINQLDRVKGNTDRNTVIEYDFEFPLQARYVKMIPIEWHVWISSRLDVLAGPKADVGLNLEQWKELNFSDANNSLTGLSEIINTLKSAFPSSFGFK